MKNKIGAFALTGILAVTAAFSMTAFAENTAAVVPSTGGSIVQGDIATADIAIKDKFITNYVSHTGKIESITQKDGTTTIAVANENGGIVFHVQDGVFIVSNKDNSYLQLSDLKEGMEITGVVKANSPQTMSLPPQTPGAVGFVVNDREGFTSVGRFDGELVNAADKLQLNIDKDTMIVDQKGTKKVFTAEDVKNQDAIVFYTTTTRSIPAQTSPSFVMILDVVEEMKAPAISETPVAMDVSEISEEPSTPVATIPVSEPKATEVVALRGAAESAGFTVKWTANDQPVILEKDGISVSVAIGQTAYSKNGEAMNASVAPALNQGQIFVSSDVADILK